MQNIDFKKAEYNRVHERKRDFEKHTMKENFLDRKKKNNIPACEDIERVVMA